MHLGSRFFLTDVISDATEKALCDFMYRSAEKGILYVSRRFNLTATGRADGQTPSWSCPSRLDLIESRTVLPEGRTLLYLMGTSSHPHIKQRARVAYSVLDCDMGIRTVANLGSTPGTTTEGKTTPNLTHEKVVTDEQTRVHSWLLTIERFRVIRRGSVRRRLLHG